MNTNNLKSSLYSSLLLSNDHFSKLETLNSNNNFTGVKVDNSIKIVNGLETKVLKKQIYLNKCEKSNTNEANSDNINQISNKIRKSISKIDLNSKNFSFVKNSDVRQSNISPKKNETKIPNFENESFKKIDLEDFNKFEEKKMQENMENTKENNLIYTKKSDCLLNTNENKSFEKEIKYDIYLRSNLIKIIKDENNETIISVPCKLNMDIESLFYYFSNNSIYLKCKQFANMLHFSKLYHKSKPIDILGRMFPSTQENLPFEERQVEFNCFLKLLQRFSQFKFRSIGASEEEKINLVVSFLLNCDYIGIISNKLIKSERCIQVNDPTIQRKEKDIQISVECKDNSSQMTQCTNSIAVDATYSVSDACCYCNIEQELNLTNIQKEFNEPPNIEHQNQVSDYLNYYNIQEQSKTQEIVKPEVAETMQDNYKKSLKKNSQKKIQKNTNSESEILIALTSINQEDDRKLYRIFVYYSGPNSDRLSYRQFYNLMNDSGLLGGNFEEFITPVQLERCYSAVITNPKGLDYWEFKEILLYCGEASSCGNDSTSAFQSIIRKYIIPLILMIYQPNNFEKCEDVVLSQTVSEEFDNVKSLQTMINKAILPWFRLGSRPILSESDDYSDTCSCSSLGSSNNDSEDNNSSTSSSYFSSSTVEETNTQQK